MIQPFYYVFFFNDKQKRSNQLVLPKTWCTKIFRLFSRTSHGYSLTSFQDIQNLVQWYNVQKFLTFQFLKIMSIIKPQLIDIFSLSLSFTLNKILFWVQVQNPLAIKINPRSKFTQSKSTQSSSRTAYKSRVRVRQG